MSRQAAGVLWPSVSPPTARGGLRWELHDVSQLPHVRARLRRYLAERCPGDDELRDRLVLAVDEMASNALRHARGRVQASVRSTDDGYLIMVSDGAPESPPVPAVGRDASEGGLGLYLIAELASRHGWYVSENRKHVWALIPR